MKKIIISVLCLFLFSCSQEKLEFIPSKTINNVFFLKNLPKNDSILKREIKDFIYNSKANKKDIYFYKYTYNTRFFLNHKEDSSCMLDDFLEDELASYIITKCKADTTKLIGNYLFYGLKGAEKNIFKVEIDTIIFECRNTDLSSENTNPIIEKTNILKKYRSAE